jgi:hypothetical protein
MSAPDPSARGPALAQGAFYLATGVWPLVSLRTFEAVTGPKRDKWLVRTIGVLLGVTGAALLRAARHGRVSGDLAFLAAAMAAGIGVVEGIAAGSGRVSRTYLADVAVEAAFTAGWLRSLRSRQWQARAVALAQAE